MSNYAIIQINHNQYLVEEGKTYSIPKFAAEVGKFKATALATNTADGFQVGSPSLDKAEVTLDVLEHGKGEKITTRISKAKSRYRKTSGYRKLTTTFQVVSIK